MTKELIDAATAYLEQGFQIIALTGKRPNGHFHEHGLSEPISGRVADDEDRELLRDIFDHPTTSGVGILIPEHMLVADVDTDEAATALMELSGGVIPETVSARTRNGLHLWFLAPGAERSLWVHRNGDKTLLFRGAGSYVAAPPSRHPEGGKYSWLRGFDEGIGWLPDGVAGAIATASLLKDSPARTYSSWLWQLTYKDGAFTLHKEAADPDMTGLIRAVEECQPGNRNNMLAWAALTAAEEGISLEQAMPLLTAAALKAGLDARETRVTIRQAYRRRRG